MRIIGQNLKTIPNYLVQNIISSFMKTRYNKINKEVFLTKTASNTTIKTHGKEESFANWGIFKVFKYGPSKICGRQPLKNLRWYGLVRQTISLQIFERLSSTNLLGPFLNTLTHIHLPFKSTYLIPHFSIWCFQEV